MIVFSIAFGKPYIDKLFDRCLPSLFSESRPPRLENKKISFFFFTLVSSAEYLKSRAANSRFSREFGGIAIVPADIRSVDNLPVSADSEPPRQTAGTLLQAAIQTCIKMDEVFVHAVPDLVYTPHAIETAHNLHKLTGKVVAIFNGRVKPTNGVNFTTETLLRAGSSEKSCVDFFFRHMNPWWQANTTTSLDRIAGTDAGHLAVNAEASRMIFCAAPNPFLGTFLPSDLPVFSHVNGMSCWDQSWRKQLIYTNRLLVQTNLDAGMSIEPEDHDQIKKNGAPPKEVERSIQMVGDSPILRRQLKFDGDTTSLFTTSY